MKIFIIPDEKGVHGIREDTGEAIAPLLLIQLMGMFKLKKSSIVAPVFLRGEIAAHQEHDIRFYYEIPNDYIDSEYGIWNKQGV